MSTIYTTMNSSSSTHTLLPTSSTEEHTYVDYANCYNEEKKVSTMGGVREPFPVKLFKLLEFADLQDPDLASVISWHSHGRCFRVHNPKKSEEFLHRFFNQNKYSSFRRQLNLWGFKRLTQNGADNGAYYHEMFLRSKPFLCRSIRRKAGFSGKQNKNKKCAASNSDTEPKFFLMAPLPPSRMLATSSVSVSPDEATRISCNDTIVSARTTRRSPFDITFDAEDLDDVFTSPSSRSDPIKHKDSILDLSSIFDHMEFLFIDEIDLRAEAGRTGTTSEMNTFVREVSFRDVENYPNDLEPLTSGSSLEGVIDYSCSEPSPPMTAQELDFMLQYFPMPSYLESRRC